MKQTIEENPIWIPLQTTYCKELQVAEFLRDSEIPYYIPQTIISPRLMSCRTQKMEASVANGFLFPPSIICFSYDVATTIADGADVCSSPFLFPRIS